MANQSVPQTLPYDAVWETCNELVSLAISIENAANTAICGSSASNEMALIRVAATRIGLLADHITGGRLGGDAEYWAKLPDIEQAELEP